MNLGVTPRPPNGLVAERTVGLPLGWRSLFLRPERERVDVTPTDGPDGAGRPPVATVLAIGRHTSAKPVAGIAAFTVVLTAFFLGLSGFLTGGNPGFSDRVPYYVFMFAALFVAGVYLIDERADDPEVVLAVVAGISVAAFVLLGVAIEGVVYAARNSDTVLGSEILVYFAAAGLFCIGVGIWLMRNWRDLR